MIKAQNLYKEYKKKPAVDDISFNVESGKVTGFLGPNGAGKSTTMRLMLSLDNGRGQTTFDDKKLNEYDRLSGVIGILLEAKAFHPTRSAKNHLKILAAAGGLPDSRVDEVLDIVGLKEVAKKKPGKFSLGMSQRLGIAAAILGQPKYLLLDEPANGLDPEGIAWLREFLKDYAKQGNAVFVSSHLLSEMAQLADNVVVIGRGKLIADTSMEKLLDNNKKSSVFVRTTKLAQFEKAVQKQKFDYVPDKKGLTINDVDTDTIGKLAYKNGLTVLELANHVASLEDVFLELTENDQEFSGKNKKGKE